MAIRFKCPHCSKALAVKDHLGGKKAACPVCKKAIVIPAPEPVTSPTDLEALAAAALADDAAAAAAQAAEDLGKQTIDFDCPFCTEAIRMPLSEAGKQGQCPECKHIIKIPLPQKTGPKDWRDLAKQGPSAALINQPEQLDGAWGTEVKTKVGQRALAEAEALPEVTVEPIGVGGWLRRISIVLVVGGIIAGLWVFIKNKRIERDDKDAISTTLVWLEPKNPKGGVLPSKLPSLQTAELYRALGELHMAKDERANALTMFQKARAVIVDAVAEKDKDKDREAAKDRAQKEELDRDLFLADLCGSITLMGGGDKEDIDKTRYLWTNEVQTELTPGTLQALRTTDGKIIALRALANVLFDKKQGDLAVTLANGVAGSDPRLQAQAVALRIAHGKDAPTAKIPDDGASLPRETRIAQAEGLTRKGQLEEARKFAAYKGKDPAAADRIEANVGAALVLLDRPKGQEAAKEAMPFFEEAMAAYKEGRGTPRMTLELMRVGYLLGQDEQVKSMDKSLSAAFKARAQFDKFQAKLARADAPVPLDAMQEMQADPKLDKDGNAPALAWLAVAHHNARLGASGELNNHLATLKDDSNLKPLVRVGIALATRK